MLLKFGGYIDCILHGEIVYNCIIHGEIVYNKIRGPNFSSRTTGTGRNHAPLTKKRNFS